MILTLSTRSNNASALIERIVGQVSNAVYKRNLYAAITWENGRRVRFTLRTRDSKKHGSRTSSRGRHMPHASWEAHRDVMFALFAYDPNARLQTALAIYRGAEDFRAKFLATGHKNVGSMMWPVTMRETTV